MSTLPLDITIAVVEGELPALEAYSRRHGVTVTWKPDELLILMEVKHPIDGSSLTLRADVHDYRAHPPTWTFNGPDQQPRFPSPGQLPGGIGSIFHSSKLICAPFNRTAYADKKGPHNDWQPANWLQIPGNVPTARTLAEMLSVILAHLKFSPGYLT